MSILMKIRQNSQYICVCVCENLDKVAPKVNRTKQKWKWLDKIWCRKTIPNLMKSFTYFGRLLCEWTRQKWEVLFEFY